MKVDKSVGIENADMMTVADLKRFLDSVPDTALVWISTHKSDRNLMDYHSMKFSWKEEL